jgi:hypothetical protein
MKDKLKFWLTVAPPLGLVFMFSWADMGFAPTLLVFSGAGLGLYLFLKWVDFVERL